MRRAILLLFLALPAFAQTAKFPTAVATDADLTKQKDKAQSTITAAMNASQTSVTVVTGSKFVAGMIVSIDNEQALVCSVVGTTVSFGYASCPNVDGRGYADTVAASHVNGSLISGNIVAWNHNSLAAEVKAIEAALGASMANVPVIADPLPQNKGGTGTGSPLTGIAVGNGAGAFTAVAGTGLQGLRRNAGNTGYEFAASAPINSADYNFATQSPAGALGVGNTTITISPVPLGVNWNDAPGGVTNGHKLWIAGTGTPEACYIVTAGPGTATSGAASGTLTINCAGAHGAGFTVASSSAGLQEAVVATPSGARINIPAGTYVIRATVAFGAYHQFVGIGRGALGGSGTTVDARTVSGPAFRYLSEVLGAGYDVDSGIEFSNLTMECLTTCIQINAEAIPTYQGNIRNSVFRDVTLNGSYGTAVDADRYTATVPALATVRAFGTGISCNQCFDSVISNVTIGNFGIGTYIQGDVNVIEAGSRYLQNANDVWIDGASGFTANTNKIVNSEFLANRRVAAVRLASAAGTIIQNNYFETYCPSAQFVRSTGSTGLNFSHNRIEDPANAPGCILQGGPNTVTTTPVLHLDDFNSVQLFGNFMNIGGGAVPPLSIAYTHWTTDRPNFIECLGNNQFFPCPNGQYQTPVAVFFAMAPGVLSQPLNPYLLRANNVPSDVINGASATSFSATWQQSSVLKQADNSTGRWVLGTGSGYVFTFKLQDAGASTFIVRFTGRKIGTGAGGYTLQYTDAAATTTTLSSGNLSFTATTETEIKDVIVALPAAASGPGRFTLTLDGSNAEFEQVELIPSPGSVLAYSAAGAPQSNAWVVFGTCTLGTNCAVTFTKAWTSSSSYRCTATDQAVAAAVKVVNTSASVATFTGTGTDVLGYICIGN